MVAALLALSWLELSVQNSIEFASLNLLSTDNSLPVLVTALLFVGWSLLPARRLAAALLLVRGLLHLVGAIVTVIPFGFLFLVGRVGGEERSVKAGESITIPANTPHYFSNDGKEEAHSVQWFRPALNIDRFFESYFGLAQDGKLGDDGPPSLWQLAVMAPCLWGRDKAPQPALGPYGN